MLLNHVVTLGVSATYKMSYLADEKLFAQFSLSQTLSWVLDDTQGTPRAPACFQPFPSHATFLGTRPTLTSLAPGPCEQEEL